MWNDDAQLEEELNWKPRAKGSDWVRTPRGVSAIMALGGALTLPMMALTLSIVGSARDLGAVMLILVITLEGLIAFAFAQFLWRVIGPAPRVIIRQFMILGPLPPLALMCCFGAGLFGKESNPHFQGRGWNWAIPKEGEAVRLGEVQALCAKLGPTWRIPREDEVERLSSTPPLAMMPARLANAAYTNYWLQPSRDVSPPQDVFLQVLCMNKQCRPEVRREPRARNGQGENTGAALCVDF